MSESFDLIVIGAGPGGYTAAAEAARRGKKVALCESGLLGGTCLNRGCIPTKTLLHTTELLRQARDHGGTLGLTGTLSLDGAALARRVTEVSVSLGNGVAMLLKKHRVTLAEGRAAVAAPGTVTAGDRVLSAPAVLIATGSMPARPPIPGAALPGVLTSDDLLAGVGRQYDSLVILGGGVIGMELASVYAARGTRVTVLEALDRPLANFDREISQNLKMILRKRGVDIRTDARVVRIEETPAGLLCTYTEKDAPQMVTGDAVLLAAGRKPNTEGLFAPGLTPETNRGYLITNDSFETSIPGVYAIGDVTGGIQLAHRAAAQARTFAALFCGEAPPVRLDLVPLCVYTDPEIACVGLSEADAKAQGRAVKTRKYVMGANGKSVLTLQERGFIKAVLDAETGALLGAQLMCARATDMISEFTLAAALGLTGQELGGIIRAHPTFEEAVGELFSE